MIERSFFEAFDLSADTIEAIMTEIASDTARETEDLRSRLDRAEASLAELESKVSGDRRRAFVYGALGAAGMTSELAKTSAADMLVSKDADLSDTLDEEIERLKELDPAAFAPVPRQQSELPQFSCSAPMTRLPDTSPLFENGTPVFNFLRRPSNNG